MEGNTSQPLISVIVPVYKVEKHLRQCVDSIINQTYTNLEIILVDDGSPDGCPTICDEYAEKDSRIKVIHKENSGPSCARNSGLDIAKGDYISFIDSDDFIANNFYSSFADNFPFDIAICGLKIVDENLQIIESKQASQELQFANFQNDYETVRNLVFSSLFGYPVNKLFKSEILNGIRYKNFQSREDFIFVTNAVSKVNCILIIPYDGYYYIQHDSSLLHSDYSGLIPDINAIISELNTIHPLLPWEENRIIASKVIKVTLVDSLRKFVFFNKALSENEKKIYTKKLFSDTTLENYLRFSSTDDLILKFLIISYKFHLPLLFFTVMKRIWKYE